MMNLVLGNILMFDVMMDKNIDIVYNKNCMINWFKIINNTNLYHSNNNININQIQGSCNNNNDTVTFNINTLSLLSDSSYSYTTHWIVYSIKLIYDDEYYSGGKLYIHNYSILGVFNNEIILK